MPSFSLRPAAWRAARHTPPAAVRGLAAALTAVTMAMPAVANEPTPSTDVAKTVIAAPSPAAIPVPVYRSALERYRRHADAPVAPWRESNDTVGRIGGWKAYAREAQAAERAASAP